MLLFINTICLISLFLCGSVSADNANWMRDYAPFIALKAINEVNVPGTHDSATDKIGDTIGPNQDLPKGLMAITKLPGGDHIFKEWAKSQQLTVFQQLELGIRFFDFRVSWNDWEEDFYITHSLYAGPLRGELKQIRDFLITHPKEIVIIQISHINYMPEGDASHHKLAQLINSYLGQFAAHHIDGKREVHQASDSPDFASAVKATRAAAFAKKVAAKTAPDAIAQAVEAAAKVASDEGKAYEHANRSIQSAIMAAKTVINDDAKATKMVEDAVNNAKTTVTEPIYVAAPRVTVQHLWNAGVQAIIIYEPKEEYEKFTKIYPFLWPSNIFNSPWANEQTDTTALKQGLDKGIKEAEPHNKKFHVTQAQLTPNTNTIKDGLLDRVHNKPRSLKDLALLVRCHLPEWIDSWVKEGKRTNIIIHDFATPETADWIIKKNNPAYKEVNTPQPKCPQSTSLDAKLVQDLIHVWNNAKNITANPGNLVTQEINEYKELIANPLSAPRFERLLPTHPISPLLKYLAKDTIVGDAYNFTTEAGQKAIDTVYNAPKKVVKEMKKLFKKRR